MTSDKVMTMSKNCRGWAARDDSGLLSPYEFERRSVGGDDVSVKITHCGVCYADVAYTRNKRNSTVYPVVPGHEIVGIVQEVGDKVSKFKIGDHVGVGTFVDSCRECEYCEVRHEEHCSKATVTINGTCKDGTITKGGYSSFIVVHERYCYKIPERYPLALAAPLLCAGITVYNPMIHHKMNQPGKSLGVVGLGGLGHMAVRFAKAFGLNVTVFSTSTSKKDDALNLLKADKFVLSSDTEQMSALSKSLDFIIDTASGDHPLDLYMSLLKIGGVLALVGNPGKELKLSPLSLLMGMRSISGSAVGGTKRTQEMLEFCAKHEIHPEIEVIPIQYANDALERIQKNDVKYRFVIDIESSLE
ncbi:probable cinnamyl alcohol dehydrogenase 1 [Rhodamnia argentea]|uniref:Probable cinnamyl alcohol dehydrogenase 1 n=1 Tax=Rhodamnia argentea TaxID=178133 RepID=A0A8B8QS55_9MYRT|nr:probable cinnamyl alcohol dehydrogenase 1 [Rhodamnia argentea]